MLSNTAETKPRPRVVCQEAAGNFSTGMSDAQVTRASRKTEPLNASGSSLQSGRRSVAVSRIATQTAAPMTGKWSSTAGKYRLAATLAPIAASRMTPTIAMRAQSTRCWTLASLMIGE
jgi:hypothetical protein